MQKSDNPTRTVAPPIDVPQTSNVPAVRNAPLAPHVEPDMDSEIDAKLGLQPDDVAQTGHEVTVSPHYKVATPFPKEVQDALRAFRNIPDEMIDIKPNGQIYLSNRYASELFDEIFGFGGWALVPVKNITERKVMKRGTSGEYEIITFYQMYRAYALGQYVRDVSGAGTYFSNNPEQNYSDAVESAESYAINRLAKRLGVGRNLRDPIYASEWVAKYAFEDPAVTREGQKWKKRPAAGGVPVPPPGSKTWTAELVKLFKPAVGEDAAHLADALEKLTRKAWGIERASRSFRDLKNHESYELCRRLASGELTIPTIAPRRASDVQAAEMMKKWPQARREGWTAAHEGDGKPACEGVGCKACRWDEWETAALANVQVIEEKPAAAVDEAPAVVESEPMRILSADEVAAGVGGPIPPKFKCEACQDNGCAMCLGDAAGADEEIPPAGDRKTIEAAMLGTLCPKPRHGRFAGLFCPACADPSLLDDADAADREAAENEGR